jgi:hypothetical protein
VELWHNYCGHGNARIVFCGSCWSVPLSTIWNDIYSIVGARSGLFVFVQSTISVLKALPRKHTRVINTVWQFYVAVNSINARKSSMKSAWYFCLILKKFEFSWRIFIMQPNTKFHENPSIANTVATGGQKDEKNVTNAFRCSCERSENVSVTQ